MTPRRPNRTLPILGLSPADGRVPLLFNWGVSSFFGWGINGLNLMLSLADHAVFTPVAAQNFDPGEIMLDPLREARLAPLVAQSQEVWNALSHVDAEDMAIEGPALIAITQDFGDPGRVAHRKRIYGQPHIGVAFLEHVGLSPDARRRAQDFALIIAGCRWNERLLRAHGIHAVTTVLQGVDTALFHPAPKSGALGRDRFVVFSGGKLELRKGQDLVLAIFRAFHRRHPEALLLTAWFSPWSNLMETAVATRGIVAPRPTPDGHPDILSWAEDNDIPPDAVIPVGSTPNIAMPHVIREADVALFPNRAEGGTNLVAMECMACGIPTILSANTGHLDLLRYPGLAIPLRKL